MKDGIRVFLTDEVENKIKREANAEHLSPGEYISMVLSETMSEKGAVEEESPDEETVRAQDRKFFPNIYEKTVVMAVFFVVFFRSFGKL